MPFCYFWRSIYIVLLPPHRAQRNPQNRTPTTHHIFNEHEYANLTNVDGVQSPLMDSHSCNSRYSWFFFCPPQNPLSVPSVVPFRSPRLTQNVFVSPHVSVKETIFICAICVQKLKTTNLANLTNVDGVQSPLMDSYSCNSRYSWFFFCPPQNPLSVPSVVPFRSPRLTQNVTRLTQNVSVSPHVSVKETISV